MRARSFVVVSCIVIGLCGSIAPRAEEPIDSAQGVIENQLSAFMKDDVEAAYSFTSPGIQRKFPNPNDFFDMVKRGYGPLYRPMHFAFGRNRIVEGHVFQEMIVSAPDGSDWTALYHLIKLPDGRYKINAVRLFHTATGPEI